MKNEIHNIEYPISLIHQRWIIGSIDGVESNGNLQIVHSEEKKFCPKKRIILSNFLTDFF